MFVSLWLPILTSSLFYTPALSALVEYDLVLSTKLGDAYSPDCQDARNQRRWLFLAGPSEGEASNPGPLIEAEEGDTIRIHVTNHHPTMVATIHYHGIHQRGTPWADGPAQVTQCGLNPLQSQVYEFEAYPAGSHYWHAHIGFDLADGLTGPLIVKAKDPEPFQYDEERVVFLQDYYSQTGVQQEAGVHNWPFTWVGNPDSLLINGKGIAAKCQGDSFGENLCLSTCNDTLALLPTIEVQANKTYRLRIINSAALVMMNIAVSGHNLTIVEIEGTNVEPVTVPSFDLSPGQRVSVLLKADQEPGTYWLETTVRERNIPGLTGRAILKYEGVDLALPSLEPPSHPAWDDNTAALVLEDSLLTLDVSEHPEASALNSTDVDRYVLVGTQNLLLDDTTGKPVKLRWAVNNISYAVTADPLIGAVVSSSRKLGWPSAIEHTVDMPKAPPTTWNYTEKIDITDGGPGGSLGMQETTVVRLEKGQVFEFVLQNARALNGAAEFHPWHVHGHSFWVVGRGEGTFDPEVDVLSYNLENPVLRDTVTLWPLGWVALRLVADNPGVWFFHCHITAHQVMGMGFVIVVQPNEIGEPSESVAFCGRDSLAANTGAISSGNLHGGPGLSFASIILFCIACCLHW